MMSCKHKLLLVAALLAPGVTAGRLAHAQAGNVQGTSGEWASYGGDKASSKYSPLDQIDAANFHRLQIAWTWKSADEEIVKANPGLSTWVWNRPR